MYRQVHTFFSWNFYGLFIELREHRVADFVHIADYAVGAVIEYRGVRIGVDSDDGIRVREARDMVHGAGDTEGNVQLRLYHNSRLAYNELKRQNAAVKHRPCAGKLSAEPFGKTAVARQSVSALYGVSDADYNIGVCDVQALVQVIGAEVKYLRAYILNGKVDVFLNDLVFMHTARRALESAGTDRSNLRTRHGNCDNGHHLTADGRLYEFNIRSFRVPYELGGIRGAACAEACGKARSKVAAVYRSPDHDRRRAIFLAQDSEQVRISVVVEIVVARAGYADELIYTAVEHFPKLRVADAADDNGHELFAACVAQLARFRAQLERYRKNAVAVTLDKDPHVLKISLIHTCTSLKHVGDKLHELIHILFRAALVDHAAFCAGDRWIGARHLRR